MFHDPRAGQKHALIYNPGDCPLTDVEVDLQDYTTHREDHSHRQTVIPHASAPYRYTLANGEREDFLITFSAVNGAWFETLQLRKVNGVWQQALKVERFPKIVKRNGTTRPRTIRQYVDLRYPHESSTKIEWCKFISSRPSPEPNPCIPKW